MILANENFNNVNLYAFYLSQWEENIILANGRIVLRQCAKIYGMILADF